MQGLIIVLATCLQTQPHSQGNLSLMFTRRFGADSLNTYKFNLKPTLPIKLSSHPNQTHHSKSAIGQKPRESIQTSTKTEAGKIRAHVTWQTIMHSCGAMLNADWLTPLCLGLARWLRGWADLAVHPSVHHLGCPLFFWGDFGQSISGDLGSSVELF